jgi:uncharacterized protein with NRDE domain
MCTVSFVNSKGKIFITSNRDEQIIRPAALPPEFYEINNRKILFPKDAKAGGTWFAVSETGNVIVLLNGAKEKHDFKPNFYQKSRGLIVLELIATENIIKEWGTISLDKVEPFTLVVYENQKLYQLQWDEVSKDTKELNILEKYIWSSSTLYPKEIRAARSNWFFDFVTPKSTINKEDLFSFHSNKNPNDSQNGLVINRENLLKTISISQLVIEEKNIIFDYSDLMSNQKFTNSFQTN